MMLPQRLRNLPGDRRAILYAVLVHLMLVAIVAVGWRIQSRPVIPVSTIQATVVPDVESKKELERRKQQDRERAQQEAQKKREQEQVKAAEQKRKLDEQRKVEVEKKRKETERQAEVQRKKESGERQKATEQSLREQLVSEEKERAADKARVEQAARAQSEVTRFEGLIRLAIERNWVRPAGWTREMECVVRVRLAPTGEVIGVTIARSSGNASFDRSVENAVYKASPLPLPPDKALFDRFRELELRFRPEGNA